MKLRAVSFLTQIGRTEMSASTGGGTSLIALGGRAERLTPTSAVPTHAVAPATRPAPALLGGPVAGPAT